MHDCQRGCKSYHKLAKELKELKKQPYKCRPDCFAFKAIQELDRKGKNATKLFL